MNSSPRILALFALLCGLLAAGATPPGVLYRYTQEELVGPAQPIEFSHKVHATDLAIGCLYCHGPAERGQHAAIPAVSVCVGCHQWVKQRANGSPEEIARSAREIAKIQDFYGRGEPIPWVRVHGVPEYVQFKHMRHLRAGIRCQECHGPVETMNRVYLVKDTRLRPHSLWLPAAKLQMGWCIDCHERRRGSIDCAACHV